MTVSVTRAQPVGLVGLGAMGRGMAANLLAHGWQLHVHTRTRATAAQALADGAVWQETAAGVGHACTAVVLCLPDAAAVQDVLFGTGGLAAAMPRGGCIVDTSTIGAPAARDLHARLQQAGIGFLDAPVSGGEAGARAGTLGCMVGGEAEVVDACRELLSAFCKVVTHVGPAGAGQAVKSCNQVAVSAALLGVAEALALAAREGLDGAQVREVLLGGTARSFALEMLAPRILEGRYQPGFRARLMRKDLRLALAAAQGHGQALPAAETVERLLDGLCENGGADLDWSALATRLRD